MARLTDDDVAESSQNQTVSEQDAIVLGRKRKGDRALWLKSGWVLWPLELLLQHLLIFGKTEQGKTTTALRIVYEVVRKRKEQGKKTKVFFFDGNADFKFGRRFCQAMLAAGLEKIGVFPHQRFNGWPDNWRAIYDRLLTTIRFAEEGPATFYTDASALALRLACRLGNTPPSSTKDLLSRLNPPALLNAYSPEETLGLDPKEIKSVRMRVNSVYGSTGTVFDGDWSYRDVDAAYLGIDPMVFKKTAGIVLQMLLSELEYYVKYEKDEDELVVVVIDEFASLAGVADVAMFVEQARKLGVCVILLSQTVVGLGNEAEKARLMYNVGMVLAHKTHEHAALLDLIAMKRDPELTLRYQAEFGMEPDRLRHVEVPKVKKGDLSGMTKGEAYLFIGDKAMKLKVEKPDESGYKPFELPEQEELDEPLQLRESKANESKEPIKLPGFAKDDLGASSFKGARFHVRREDGEIPEGDDIPEGDSPAADGEEPSP